MVICKVGFPDESSSKLASRISKSRVAEREENIVLPNIKKSPPITSVIRINNTTARILEIAFLFFNKKIKGGEDFVFIYFTYG
jgi:hypothetical protein